MISGGMDALSFFDFRTLCEPSGGIRIRQSLNLIFFSKISYSSDYITGVNYRYIFLVFLVYLIFVGDSV